MKSPGQILYEVESANDPHIHCNRFALWGELSDDNRAEYERRAGTTTPASDTPRVDEARENVRDLLAEAFKLERELTASNTALAEAREREASLRDTLDTIGQSRVCRSPYTKRPILYTDTVNGAECHRDDLWAVSTDELNSLVPK